MTNDDRPTTISEPCSRPPCVGGKTKKTTGEEKPPAPVSSGDEDEFRRGKIAGVAGDDVFVDLGVREQGVLSVREFDVPPQVGESFEFSIVGEQDDLLVLSRKEARRLETWRSLAPGKWVTAIVTGSNKGGLELKVGPIAAFMPISQIDTAAVEDLDPFVGQKMVCAVTEVNSQRSRVVLSRRKVLEAEQRQKREATLATIAVGQVLRGTVEKIEPFGAFVNIGPSLTGLLHVSNLSHERVEDPSSVVKEGETIEVMVLEVEDGGRRIGLGLKQLKAHPWDGAEDRWTVGKVTEGKITRLADFGVFVELEKGVEGLAHVSELGLPRGRRVHDAFKIAEPLTVRVLAVDMDKKRISLSSQSERGRGSRVRGRRFGARAQPRRLAGLSRGIRADVRDQPR